MAKKQFTLKTYGAKLYKWSPIPTNKQKFNTDKPQYCNAFPGTQGEDWVSTYSYTVGLSSINQVKRLAYVECDYVE